MNGEGVIMRTKIGLLQRDTGHLVTAALIDEPEIDFQAQHDQWAEWMGCYRKLGQHGDAAWDWRSLLDEEKLATPWATCFAIEAKGRYQGLMITGGQETSNLTAHAGERLLYINYLASAPWNRGDFTTRRTSEPPTRLSGIGLFFVLYAIQISESRGLGGRVGLHSLRGAIEFYVRSCHFTYVGARAMRADPPHPWLEIPSVSAAYLTRVTQEV